MEGPVSTTLGIVYAFDWEMKPANAYFHHRLRNIMPLNKRMGIQHKLSPRTGLPDELIQQSLMTAMFSARKQLIMTTPYFVPSDDLCMQFVQPQCEVSTSVLLCQGRMTHSLFAGQAAHFTVNY